MRANGDLLRETPLLDFSVEGRSAEAGAVENGADSEDTVLVVFHIR